MATAIIGTGISGLGCAYRLARAGELVVVFEAAKSVGGHTATKQVSVASGDYAIDTGFIVYNDWTYPEFISLMDELGVTNQPTSMGFSVSDDATGLEYAGNNLNTLFAQRRNLLSPKFVGMVREILRFNKVAVEDLEAGRLRSGETLEEYLQRHGFNEFFRRNYLISMASAIWSAKFEESLNFPAEFFVRFFKNHGLLQVKNRPQWRVLRGGSQSYLAPISAPFEESIRTNCEVAAVVREANQSPKLRTCHGEELVFDDIVIATHADQAMAMLSDIDDKESRVLSELPYSENAVVLHTDTRLLPKKKLAWSSWNYRLRESTSQATLTYNMNILQGINSPETFCVTLNDTNAIDASTILGEYRYAHPQFTIKGIASQQRWIDINGPRNTWFCGAYWRNGFHEDGLFSGNRVANAIIKKRGLQ
jgi:predicted NAD/FAD-binding protein